METVVERPAGLDVHKAQVTACVRVPAAAGGGRDEHIAVFQTTVTGLLTLRDWLAAHRVTQVVMQATGVYLAAQYARLDLAAQHARLDPDAATRKRSAPSNTRAS